MKGRVSSGGYSNLGPRGKDFQKLTFSKKEKGFDLSVFSPKIKVFSKKKKDDFRNKIGESRMKSKKRPFF